MSQAATDVLAERQRQVTAEGCTPGHDDGHTECDLAGAAAAYALCTGENYLGLRYQGVQVWPSRWVFKDGGYRRNLVKAAALLLAEIERLDRTAIQSQGRG